MMSRKVGKVTALLQLFQREGMVCLLHVVPLKVRGAARRGLGSANDKTSQGMS